MGDGIYYLPDFLLHDVHLKSSDESGKGDGEDVYVEVKGRMTADDAKKIGYFAGRSPILVVGNIPNGETFSEIQDSIIDVAYDKYEFDVSYYNFCTIMGDEYAVFPGVDDEGKFVLFGGDYMDNVDEIKSANAYRLARQARFEHGEKPSIDETKPARDNGILDFNAPDFREKFNSAIAAKLAPDMSEDLVWHLFRKSVFVHCYANDNLDIKTFDLKCLSVVADVISAFEKEIGTRLIVAATNALVPVNREFRLAVWDMSCKAKTYKSRVECARKFVAMIRDHIAQHPDLGYNPRIQIGKCAFCPCGISETRKITYFGVIKNVPPYGVDIHWFFIEGTNDKFFSAGNLSEAIYGKFAMPHALHDIIARTNVKLHALSNADGMLCTISLEDTFRILNRLTGLEDSSARKVKANAAKVLAHVNKYFNDLLAKLAGN